MGATHIPSAMAQMDGFFGCKVVEEVGDDGKRAFFFVERDFIDWIRDMIFCLENVKQTRTRTIAALDDIASQIKGVDGGNFSALVRSCKNNVEEIDFKKVKGMLQNSLFMQFPPDVYERPNDARATLPSYEEERARKLKVAYINNFIRGACTETSVEIVRDLSDLTVSDLNLKALVSAFHEVEKSSDEHLYVNEWDKSVQRRVDELLQDRSTAAG